MRADSGTQPARRFGVVLYVFAITLGLVTIARVIRFQAFRLRQIANRPQLKAMNEKKVPRAAPSPGGDPGCCPNCDTQGL